MLRHAATTLLAVSLITIAGATPGFSQTSDAAATLEQRLAAIESQIVVLDTRLTTRTMTSVSSLAAADTSRSETRSAQRRVSSATVARSFFGDCKSAR